jgi:hypothetical protein
LRQRIVYQERVGGDRCLSRGRLRFWFRKESGSRRSLGNVPRISKSDLQLGHSPIHCCRAKIRSGWGLPG